VPRVELKVYQVCKLKNSQVLRGGGGFFGDAKCKMQNAKIADALAKKWTGWHGLQIVPTGILRINQVRVRFKVRLGQIQITTSYSFS
jgi:hypothetical protein